MVDLDFTVEGAEVEPHAAAPTLLFKVRVTNRPRPTPRSRTVLLQCQLRIEATRRRYAPAGSRAPRRAVRRDPPLERDAPQPALDPRQRPGAGLRQRPRRRPAGAVQLRSSTSLPPNTSTASTTARCRLSLLFSGTVFYRDADDGSLQMDSDRLEQGSELSAAGAPLAGDDGALLPQQRLAAPRPRRVRRALPLQAATGVHTPGSRPLQALLTKQRENASS